MNTDKPKKKYAKSISLYPLKWWEALAAFMKINPDKAKKIRQENRGSG